MDNALNSPPAKRSRVIKNEAGCELNKEELIKKVQAQQDYIQQLENKQNSNILSGGIHSGSISDSSRRENVLVIRLANKEQEAQDYAAQISHVKKAQENAVIQSLRQASLDPGVNLLFGKMREELQQTKDKLEQAQNELSAWKFTPDSQNGKKLMSRCRTLIAENQELGEQLSQGKTAQLESELALQKKYNDELKASQDELNEFVIQLDEEIEGMQSTIQVLQEQLSNVKQEMNQLKNNEENDLPLKQGNASKGDVKNDDKNGRTYSKSPDDYYENYDDFHEHDLEDRGAESLVESSATSFEDKEFDSNGDAVNNWENRTSVDSDNSNDSEIKACITSVMDEGNSGVDPALKQNEKTYFYAETKMNGETQTNVGRKEASKTNNSDNQPAVVGSNKIPLSKLDNRSFNNEVETTDGIDTLGHNGSNAINGV